MTCWLQNFMWIPERQECQISFVSFQAKLMRPVYANNAFVCALYEPFPIYHTQIEVYFSIRVSLFSQNIIMLTILFCCVLIRNIHLYIYTNNSHWGFVFDFQMSRYTARQETSWRRHYQSAWKNILIKTLAWEGYNLFLVSFHLILDFVVFTFNIVSITIPRAYKVSNTRIRVYIL